MHAAVARTKSSRTLVQESLQAQIDEIGFGRFQLLMLCCTGGLVLSEGSEVLMMGSVSGLLDQDWGLSQVFGSFMVSVVYIGVAAGNILAGAIGDRYGRRPTILLAYALIGILGFLTSVAANTACMILLRFGVGLGIGIGLPCIYALIPEVCPTHVRGTVCACMVGFMPLGEMFASIGVLFIDKDLEGLSFHSRLRPVPEDSWRRLCQWSALPTFIFFVISYFLLKESPLYLASQGRMEEANAVIDSLAAWNGRPRPSSDSRIDDASPEAAPDASPSKGREKVSRGYSWSSAVGTCFSRQYWVTTVVLIMAAFTKTFAVFGLDYVFPQYFGETLAVMATGWELLITSLIELPGVFAAMAVLQTKNVGGITCISLFAFLCGQAALGLMDLSPAPLQVLCAFLLKPLSMSFYVAVAVYTAQVFPTSIRSTGIGFCGCFGRLGSIVAPIFFEEEGFNVFWLSIVFLMWMVALLCRAFLTIETKGNPLVDTDEPEESHKGYGTMLLGRTEVT